MDTPSRVQTFQTSRQFTRIVIDWASRPANLHYTSKCDLPPSAATPASLFRLDPQGPRWKLLGNCSVFTAFPVFCKSHSGIKKKKERKSEHCLTRFIAGCLGFVSTFKYLTQSVNRRSSLHFFSFLFLSGNGVKCRFHCVNGEFFIGLLYVYALQTWQNTERHLEGDQVFTVRADPPRMLDNQSAACRLRVL